MHGEATIHEFIGRKLADRPLGDLNEFSTTMATNLNDLPATSPHGSDFRHDKQILGLACDPNATRGTAAAHRENRLLHPTPQIWRRQTVGYFALSLFSSDDNSPTCLIIDAAS